MAKFVSEVMTKNLTALSAGATAFEAAQKMRDSKIGNVIVLDGDSKTICGIVTDRDLITRVLADGKDPKATPLKNVCSPEVVALTPSQTTDEAVSLMRKRAVRRLPVVDGSNLIGVVSLGDMAKEIDPQSVLGQISAAPPNN